MSVWDANTAQPHDGMFILGSGGVSGGGDVHEYYYFYVFRKCRRFDSIPAWRTHVYEEDRYDGFLRMMQEIKKVQLGPWQKFFILQPDYKVLAMWYELYVPKGTIKGNFSLGSVTAVSSSV